MSDYTRWCAARMLLGLLQSDILLPYLSPAPLQPRASTSAVLLFLPTLLICCAASIIVALIPFSFSLDGWPASVSSALALRSFPCFDCFKPNPPVLHTTPSLSSTSPTVDPRHLWYRRGHLTLSTPSNVLPRPPAPSRPAYRFSLSTRLHSLNNFDSSNPQSTRRTHRQTVITD